MSMLFEATTSPTGAIYLVGELDLGTVGQLGVALAPLIAPGGPVTLRVFPCDVL